MPRILVVDDSSFMRKRIVEVLLKGGHDVIGQAENGEQAIALYAELLPDFVIMDVTMKGLDGVEAARRIKKQQQNARIIFMSLVSDLEIMEQARALGALAFLRKDEYDRLLALL